MWYVIQTKTGDEHDIMALIEKLREHEPEETYFVPLYEEVRRSGGKCRISFRRFFPGYIFVDTDRPESVFATMKRIPEFTRLLGAREADGLITFVPVGSDDEKFLNTLFDEGVVHVSLIRIAKSGRIEHITGPLAKYRNHIAKLDVPHRRAIVETEMFGKKRRIRFGLWTEDDPKLPWLEKQAGRAQEAALDEGIDADIGIRAGDRVVDESGLYGDQIFTVTAVDTTHRTVYTTTEMFGTLVRLEMRADDVSRVG